MGKTPSALPLTNTKKHYRLEKCGKTAAKRVRGDEFLKHVSNIDSFYESALKRPVRDAEKETRVGVLMKKNLKIKGRKKKG